MDARGADEGRSDPFWSVVRRRHPDIDIAVLPQDTPPAKETEPDASLVDSIPAEFDGWLAESRWVPGAVTGSLSRTALLAVEGVNEVTALQALAGAARALEQDDWHVLAPEHGMPRVLAGRDEGSRPNDAAHLTAIGHSYGSTPLAHAATDHGIDVDDIVLVGSPGAGGGVDASDLGVDADHVYVGRNSRDIVAVLGDHGRVGGDTLLGAGLGNEPGRSDTEDPR